MSTASIVAAAPPLSAPAAWSGDGRLLLRTGLLWLFRFYIGVPHVVGHQYIPEGPFVLCANHRSHLDSPALICGLGLEKHCALLAARDYFADGGIGRRLLASPFNIIALDRRQAGASVLGTITLAAAFFHHGGRVLIAYPEGTRQMGVSIAPFKRGVATLVLSLGRPVLPVFIDGTERLLPKGSHMPLPGPVTLTVGPAIEPGVRPQPGEWRARSWALIREIEGAIRRLSESRAR